MNSNDHTKTTWQDNGFVEFKTILYQEDVQKVSEWYDKLLNDKELTHGHRSDLTNEGAVGNEKITQIMRPSLIDDQLLKSSIFKRIEEKAKLIIGHDAALDFDMLINKLPYSNSETPWHQDVAYWPQLKDKRACSFWIAIDAADLENGCMAYIPGSHQFDTREHFQRKENGALSTEISEHDVVVNGILNPGDGIAHHGNTLHFAYGNKSQRNRRAWILNFRPIDMINEMRSLGYDHLGKRKNKL